MPDVAQKALDQLQRELDDLKAESRTNFRTIAVSIRRTRQHLTTIEHDESIRKLRQPTSLLDWHPRPGTPTDPKVQGGLLDRLRQGSPVSDSLGNDDATRGSSNTLLNPTMEGFPALTFGAALGTATTTRVGWNWNGFYILNSGAVTSTGTIEEFASRSTGFTPVNGSVIRVTMPTGAAASNTDVVIDTGGGHQPSGTGMVLPYFVAAIRLVNTYALGAATTAFTARVEIVDNTAGNAVIAQSADFNLIGMPSTGLRISTAVALAGISTHVLRFRVRIKATKSASAGAETTQVLIGEPQAHQSWTIDPNPFAPLLGKWQPAWVYGFSAVDDQVPTISLEGNTGQTASIRFGPGAGVARDIRIWRSSARILTIDTDGVAGAGPYLIVAPAAATDGGFVIQRTGDTTAPVALVSGTGTAPELSFGSGAAARDVRIARGIAGELVVDSLSTANATRLDAVATAGQVVHIRAFVAGDTNERISLRGDATATAIFWGPGNAGLDLRMIRTGAKTLQWDDGAAGAITVNFAGVFNIGGAAASVAGHGAADHANITRKVFLDAASAKLDAATAVNIGASPDLTGVIAYADAATQRAFWTFEVPDDWNSGVITAQPVWSPGATDGVAHTVRWTLRSQAVGAGVTVTNAGTDAAFTGASAARTVGVVVYDTATSTGITPAAAGDLFRIALARIGADAADTYVGVVNLLGIILSYTANQ